MSLSTVDKDEIIQFSKLANDWWDEEGSMSFLHAMSQIRTKFIKLELIEKYNLIDKKKVLNGLEILDLGCGGGIASEPLSRLGGNVTGIDESQKLIDVANQHAKNMKLNINYQCTSIQNLVKLKNKYDVVVALELLEHVNNLKEFCKLITNLLTEDGIIINVSGPRKDENLGEGDPSAHFGIEHFGIKVSDIEKEISRLTDLGATLLEGPIDVPNGPLIGFIKTPENVRIELMQFR